MCKSENWYEKSYRRNLVDMHIADWNDEFLSKFSSQAYFDCLKKGKIQTPMIYLQSHIGCCYWPTKTGYAHKAIEKNPNMIKELIDMCRADGMSVVGYYSLIYNSVASEEHPEWNILNQDGLSDHAQGKSRYGLCCPNNHEYRKFVFDQIAEMAEFFDLDGMFYDMLFWPEICYCESCKKRFADEVGGEIPTNRDWSDERWLKFIEKRYEWIGEFAAAVTKETKRLLPNITVEHNYAAAISGNWFPACSEAVNDACDYTGGDLYGDLYNHSFTCKYYRNVSKNLPFEYMTCRCNPSLYQHTVTKTETALTREIMLTAAHHGASLIIDAIDPIGTLDERVYERIGKVFEQHILYEPYFKGELCADVAVYYSTTSHYNPDNQDFDNCTECTNTLKNLIENNIPCTVVSNGCIEKINQYQLIFAPSINALDDTVAEKLCEYVKNGGNLFITGAGNKKLLRELIGGTLEKTTNHGVTYIAPLQEYEYLFEEMNDKYPLPCSYNIPLIHVPTDEGVMAYVKLPYTQKTDTFFASIHSNPPGLSTHYPAIILKKYGSGTVIWSAAPIDNEQIINYKRIVLNLMYLLVDKTQLCMLSDAPEQVEIISFETEDSLLVSAIDLMRTEELLKIDDFKVSIRCKKAPKSVNRITKDGKVSVAYDYTGDRVTFVCSNLIIFDMYEIDCAEE